MALTDAFFDEHCAHVPGWFGLEDFLLFRHFLETGPAVGDLLELGVYKGRSAIALGRALRPGETLHACDLFGSDGAGVSVEGYLDHPRAEFERAYAKVNSTPATVYEMFSTEACAQVADGSVRFAHIDASHLFENVVADIEAVLPLLVPGAVVVMDDYRSHHTPGVSAAFWQAVAQGRLAPVALSYQKAYCTTVADHPAASETFLRVFGADGRFALTSDEVFGLTATAARLNTPRDRLTTNRLTTRIARVRPLAPLDRLRFDRAAAATVRLHPMLTAEVGGGIGLPADALTEI